MRVSGRAVSEESARCILHEPMIPCHDTTLCQDSDARGVAVACDACDSQLLPTTSFSRPFSPSRVFRSKSCPPADFGPYPAKRSSRTQENNFSPRFEIFHLPRLGRSSLHGARSKRRRAGWRRRSTSRLRRSARRTGASSTTMSTPGERRPHS